MPRPAERQPAYILHRRHFRETSLIVDLFCRDFGRFGGVVRGVRGGRRRTTEVEPFWQLAVTWRGRGQLVNVLRSEGVAHHRLAGQQLFAGLYLNELLIKTLSPEEPAPALFRRYSEALAALAEDADMEPTLRVFERHLLDEIGYGLSFDVDLRSGRPIDADAAYEPVPGEGFQAAAEMASVRLSGRQIAAIAAGDYREPAVRRAAKRVFGQALRRRLRGTLATRDLFAARQPAPGV